ncbi:unnamed protein product [Nippostrongylus brasiliensis]|uniref:Gluconokinase n=1 Tax=Nippostrongylus brasiliensis TaxID=27835 RepID=A0A0N4YN12_NIPBR|nr:hypothetical protein Q1695_004010 [Nippostrongylus brasiliensis]VDL82331.1 unnamed protein product [Nippostrongylus brasiliensis]
MSVEDLVNKIDVVIIMGVCGCGKTTVGRRLARSLGVAFKDADEFHSATNIEKMKSGIPLNDDDRKPWLSAIHDYCKQYSPLVVGCSALKRSYRDVLREGLRCRFVFLKVNRSLLEARLNQRKDHFMNPALLDSQLATLEDPSEEPDVITVRVEEEQSLEILNNVIVQQLLQSL